MVVAVLTIAAFAIGLAMAWVSARRRLRAQVADRLAREVEARLRDELLRRWQTGETGSIGADRRASVSPTPTSARRSGE